jgi:hypothetical protein
MVVRTGHMKIAGLLKELLADLFAPLKKTSEISWN